MLHFEIDETGLADIIAELNATPRHVKYALNRARVRTATALRTMAARGLKSELELRTIGLLRKRMKTLRLRVSGTGQDGAQLWFGLNSMPVSWFTGRPTKTANGAAFRGVNFPGAFIAKSKIKGRVTILKRAGKDRLPIVEQEIPISDKAQIFIEDEIFVKTEEIFWKHFTQDLRARVRYNLGK